MSQFVQPLESRQLLSASVNLSVDEAKLALDVHGIIADANSAKGGLVADGKALVVQLKALNLKNSPLGKALGSAITQAKNKLGADVAHIVSAGLKDGAAIVADYLRLVSADSGNATKIAADQAKLDAGVTKLYNIEKPLTDKLQADIAASQTKIASAVQAIVDANKSDAALTSSWATFQSALGSAETTLSADFSQVTIDVNQLIADS